MTAPGGFVLLVGGGGFNYGPRSQNPLSVAHYGTNFYNVSQVELSRFALYLAFTAAVISGRHLGRRVRTLL